MEVCRIRTVASSILGDDSLGNQFVMRLVSQAKKRHSEAVSVVPTCTDAARALDPEIQTVPLVVQALAVCGPAKCAARLHAKLQQRHLARLIQEARALTA